MRAVGVGLLSDALHFCRRTDPKLTTSSAATSGSWIPQNPHQGRAAGSRAVRGKIKATCSGQLSPIAFLQLLPYHRHSHHRPRQLTNCMSRFLCGNLLHGDMQKDSLALGSSFSPSDMRAALFYSHGVGNSLEARGPSPFCSR